MNYDKLTSKNIPLKVDMPAGLKKDAKYVFSVTYTDPHSMNTNVMWDGMKEVMEQNGDVLAPYPDPQGHPDLRKFIAANLKNERSIETDPDSIFLSSGAGGAVKCVLEAFIDPGDVVFVEEFSYLGTMRMLLQRGAKVIHIPCDDEGLLTEKLEEEIKQSVSEGIQPKAIYTISVYQNPTGVTLSMRRRVHLLELAHRYGVPIIENESYSNFLIDGNPLPPSMYGMDDQDAVIYISAFTKLLGCGLRLGYGVVPDSVKNILAESSFGGSPSQLSSMMAYEYLKDNMETHIQNVRSSLKAKRDAMLGALSENFPPNCSWTTPSGGMMIWVKLPEGADTWKTLDQAVDAGVKYNPGGVFRSNRDSNNYLRLTYSYNTPEEIWEGIGILADVFRREGLFS